MTIEERANSIAADIQYEDNATVAFDPATALAIISLIIQIIRLYQSCHKTPSEAAKISKKPNLFQKLKLRYLVSKAVREAGLKDASDRISEAILKYGESLTVSDHREMFDEVKS